MQWNYLVSLFNFKLPYVFIIQNWLRVVVLGEGQGEGDVFRAYTGWGKENTPMRHKQNKGKFSKNRNVEKAVTTRT